MFFGTKNILIIIFFLILTITDLKSKECIEFLPFGHNEYYVHLPTQSQFCVKYGKKDLTFKTDNLGGRYFKSDSTKLQVFGDSQVLGLDIDDQNKHFLSQYYKEDFIIYAAPNNGPYEVINFILFNSKKINRKIIIHFNLSVDLFRIYPGWSINNFVALRDDQLNEILERPYKYRLIILKNLFTNKFFTVSRKNQKQMQNLFNNLELVDLKQNINLYLNQLNQITNKLGIEVHFVLSLPYWLYEQDKKLKSFIINKDIEKKIKYIICPTFNKNFAIHKKLIYQVNNRSDILTSDKRHIKSEKITLTELSNYCKF